MTYDQIIRQLRGTPAETVLLAVHEAGGQAHLSEANAATGDPSEDVGGEETLRNLGLLQPWQSLTGEISLNANGRTVAGRILQSRESGEDRHDAVTRAIGKAALEATAIDGWRVAEVDGRPVADNEIALVIDRLERWGCARPLRAFGGTIVRLMPLNRMHEFPGISGLLREHYESVGGSYVDHSTTNTTSVTGGTIGGIQTGGSGNIQLIAQTISGAEQAALLAAIGQVLAALDAEPNDRVRAEVEVIKGEVIGEGANKDSIREKVQTALITAGATGATSLVFTGLTRLLEIVVQ